LDWEWYEDHNTTRVFIHLILKSSHTNKKWRGQAITPGQIRTTTSELAKETGLSIKNIRTALNHLKSTSEVAIKNTNKYAVISINNWSEYQQDGELDGNQGANKGQTKGTLTSGLKNDKNEKNIYIANEEIIFSYFKGLEEDTPKVMEVAQKYDLRPKDLLDVVSLMLSKESEKDNEIKNVMAKLNTYITNNIRWHYTTTITEREKSEKEKKKVTLSKDDLEALEILARCKVHG
jgi:hypothetical protein